MEVRSKVAAAVASVVPFHCVICCEEFNLGDRPPVVLPCGHTFVCALCAKRLKRCMECREPLFVMPQHGNHAKPQPLHARLTPLPPPPPMYTQRGHRGGYQYNHSPLQPQQQQPPLTPPQLSLQPAPQPAPMALPIPKNVVIIAMMEAAERQIKMESDKLQFLADQTDDDTSDEERSSCSRVEDEDEYDLNCIISGMATLSGPCGTYAVKDPQGLDILLEDPRANSSIRRIKDTDDEEEKKQEAAHDHEQHQPPPPPVDSKPKHLEKGQTVQVVDFKNGIFRLARRTGFIRANPSQLVKVGAPIDKSCRLEGILDTFINRGDDLQRELDENNKVVATLRTKINAEITNQPSYPLVTPTPQVEELVLVESADFLDSPHPSTPSSCGKKNDGLSCPGTPDDSPVESDFHNRLTDLDVDENGITLYRSASHGGGPISPNSIDNADITDRRYQRYARKSRNDLPDLTLTCGSSLLADGVDLFESAAEATSNDLFGESNVRSWNTRPSHRATTRRNEDAQCDQVGPTLTSSFDGIDFRTGMSGHRALTRTRKAQPARRGEVRMMSEHRGIGGPRIPARPSSRQEKSPSSSPSYAYQYTTTAEQGGQVDYSYHRHHHRW